MESNRLENSTNITLTGEDQNDIWVAPVNTSVSLLTISRTELHHSGTYTCAPNLAATDSIKLFVSTGSVLFIYIVLEVLTFHYRYQISNAHR